MGKEELHKFDGENGTTRVRRTSRGDVVIDVYMGDVKDKDNHDRLSLNVTKGTLSGHDFGHQNPFDTSKNNTASKRKWFTINIWKISYKK